MKSLHSENYFKNWKLSVSKNFLSSVLVVLLGLWLGLSYIYITRTVSVTSTSKEQIASLPVSSVTVSIYSKNCTNITENDNDHLIMGLYSYEETQTVLSEYNCNKQEIYTQYLNLLNTTTDEAAKEEFQDHLNKL